MTDVPSSSRPSSRRSKYIKGLVAKLSRRHNHMLQAMKKNFMHRSERMKLCIAVANMMEKHTVLRKHDHDNYPGGPHEWEKNAKKQKTTQSTKSAKGASSLKHSIQGSKAPSSTQQQDFNAWSEVQDVDDDEVKLKKQHHNSWQKQWVGRVLKMVKEEAHITIQHWKSSWGKIIYIEKHRKISSDPREVFSNIGITEVIRVKKLTYEQDFRPEIVVNRADSKAYVFSSDYKYLNKNDIKDMYLICCEVVVVSSLDAESGGGEGALTISLPLLLVATCGLLDVICLGDGA
ncbi:hypothetical protein Tco_0759247 [Tanacetum coccineum]